MVASVPDSSRSPGSTLYRAIATEMLVPTAFTLAILTVLLLTQDLLGFSDLVVNRGLGLDTVLWVAFYQTVPIITQTLPFALLVGGLVGLGRLGADRELLALEASGISAARLIGPTMALAACATALAFLLSLYGSPWSNHQLDLALEQISRERPAASMSAGVIQRFHRWKIQAREVSPGGDKLKGVLVWMPDQRETVFAESGEIESDPKGSRVVLNNGTVAFDPRVRPSVLHFERMVTYLPRKESIIERTESDRLKGLALGELAELATLEASDSMGPKARIEMHRRFAMPTATLIFGLLAVPLFFSRAHFSRAGGGVLGILATLGYYGLVQLGDGMIQAGTLSIEQGVWLPNLVGGIAALGLVLRLTRMSAFGRHSDRPTTKEPKPPVAIDDPPATLRPKRLALQRYVAGSFVRMLLLCFGALLVAYFLVDFLERLDWFARYEPSPSELAQFYGWRLPVLASRVIPMALLLATGLTVSSLTAEGELVGMRACGIPAPRALAPVGLICLVATPLYFVLNDTVLPKTNAYYHETQRLIRGESAKWRSIALWYRTNNVVYQVGDLDSAAGTATDVRLYELGEDSRPISRVDAVEALHIGRGVWRLKDPIRVDLRNGGVRSEVAKPFANLGENPDVRVDTRHFSVAALGKEIAEVEAGGMDATPYRVDYYAKWAAPLSCIVLPALVLFFAVGGTPPPSAALTGIVSIVAAVTFILTTGLSTSLGYGKSLAPMVAGWAPPLLYGLIAAFLGLRLMGLRRR
jgi:lipopolysaccharide export system permease protein